MFIRFARLNAARQMPMVPNEAQPQVQQLLQQHVKAQQVGQTMLLLVCKMSYI